VSKFLDRHFDRENKEKEGTNIISKDEEPKLPTVNENKLDKHILNQSENKNNNKQI